MKPVVAALLLAACAQPQYGGHTAPWIAETSTYTGGTTLPVAASTTSDPVDAYAEVAAKIIAAARLDRGAYEKLRELTDTIGARLAGSPQLDQAIAWAAKTMKADGHEVRVEKVMVPHWVRGTSDGAILSPVAKPLHLLALGNSIATPKAGITARLVVVTSFDDLEAKKDTLEGAIVLYNVALPPYTDENNSGYGETVPYRGYGPSRAAKYGAVASLMRSVTATSLSTIHTGQMRYADDAPKIPAASITVEDATLLARLAEKGPVKLRIRFDPRMLPDAPSANVIGEIKGREKPDEIVVIGAHSDSWDVGQGAHDDGAGCVIVMQTLTLLKQLGLVPRRTIRVVLFTNEENGLRGAKAYAADHAAELPKHVFAIEHDMGAFPPRTIGVNVPDAIKPQVTARLTSIAKLLAPVGMQGLKFGDSGSDVGAMSPTVVTGGLMTDWRTYFDTHHSDADTFDKIDPAVLSADLAAMAVIAFVVADLPDRLDVSQ